MKINDSQTAEELANEKQKKLSNILSQLQQVNKQVKRQILIINICIYAVKIILFLVMAYFFCFALYAIYSIIKINF